MDVLVRAHFLIERADKRQLRAVAAGRGVSMSTLVREAVSLYLMTTSGPDADGIRSRALRSIGSLPDERRHGTFQGEASDAGYGWWRSEAESDDAFPADDDDHSGRS